MRHFASIQYSSFLNDSPPKNKISAEVINSTVIPICSAARGSGHVHNMSCNSVSLPPQLQVIITFCPGHVNTFVFILTSYLLNYTTIHNIYNANNSFD